MPWAILERPIMSNTTSTSILTSTMSDVEVSATYAAADLKGKAAIRDEVKASMTSAIMAGDVDLAQRWVAISTLCVAAKPAKSEVDYGQVASDLAATLEAAASFLRQGGLDVDGHLYRATSLGTPDLDRAMVLATPKARKAGRGAVIAYVDSVVTDEPQTIAQLRSAWVASSDYSKSAPSAGAIGAAFERVVGGAEAGFEVVDIKGTKGAVSA